MSFTIVPINTFFFGEWASCKYIYFEKLTHTHKGEENWQCSH